LLCAPSYRPLGDTIEPSKAFYRTALGISTAFKSGSQIAQRDRSNDTIAIGIDPDQNERRRLSWLTPMLQ
jgi:hypothetical protein